MPDEVSVSPPKLKYTVICETLLDSVHVDELNTTLALGLY